ncbi:MAG: M50 family metallopeptidase [Treponemataceae bacterium]|nr:M50 family metallopeptidase [Treponemataceae bacterium]
MNNIVKVVNDAMYFPRSYLNDENHILWGSLQIDKYIKIPLHLKEITDVLMKNKDKGVNYDELLSILNHAFLEDDIKKFLSLLEAKRLIFFEESLIICSSNDFKKDEFYENSHVLVNISLKKAFFNSSFAKRLSNILTCSFFILLFLSFCLFFYNLIFDNLAIYKHMFSSVKIDKLQYWMNLLFVAIISFLFHELGHIIIANKYGIHATAIQYRMYMIFQNYISVRLPGLHTLPLREKISVTIAGPFANLFVSLCSFLFLHFMRDYVLLNVFFVNMAMFISNLNPCYDTDGFHFISNILFKSNDIKSDSLNKLKSKKQLSMYNIIFISLYFLVKLFMLLVGILIVYKILDFFLINFLSSEIMKKIVILFFEIVYVILQIRSIYKYFK